MDKRYCILEVCIDLDGGGTDRYVYNYCTRIKDIHFDFASVISKNGILEKPLRELGATIYKYPRIGLGLFNNFKYFYKIMKEGHYDAVHVHLCYSSFVPLLAAKICGVKTRISHAHFANIPENWEKRLLRKLTTQLAKWFATDLAACGIDAAKWMWGVNLFDSGKVTIHSNAIESGKYRYSESSRNEKRSELGITPQTLVVGHVGRICDQKNQRRLLEIFSEMLKINPNLKLIMIGHPDQNYNIDECIDNLKIRDKVIALGIRDDVPELLNAIDVFVFPSKFEGLPFTLVETQCNGLPSLSSNAVTSQVKISNNLEFLSLNCSNHEWAVHALSLANNGRQPDAYKYLIEAGYDLDTEANKLHDYYIKLINKHD